ncbi:hypothetical protein ACFZCP_18910 [Streptomyces sp. NPDC007971]|uniref:hypothetical protein n=1 Tax=Streptomyces sp. NPDC007971 TaxID=3364799 RepID=UPI0036E479DE
MASADARCVRTSGVIRAWFRAESALEKKAMGQDPATWARLKQSYHQRTAHVRATLHRLRITP